MIPKRHAHTGRRTQNFFAWVVLGAALAGVAPRAHAQSVTKVWKENCAKCHREDGSGGGAGTKTLLTDELMHPDLDARFFKSIKEGLPESAMPGFAETMEHKDVWAMVVHTRELQAQAERARVGSPKPDGAGVYKSSLHSYRIETVLGKGLDTPWSVAFLPASKDFPTRFLVTNRPGTMELVELDAGGKPARTTIDSMPAVREMGQGGLMDAAPHPDYATNGWIYLAFSNGPKDGSKPRANFTTVVRGKIKAGADGTLSWSEQATIFEARQEHYVNSGLHFGCRIVFKNEPLGGAGEPAWHVYFGIGERGSGDKAQDVTLPNGKIYRVLEDGSIPSDNPFAQGDAQQYKQIWSFGHRNPQGLVCDLEGNLWDTEHGPRGGDELNKVEKGRNYGWPIISFGINYNDSPYRTPWQADNTEGKGADTGRFVMPVYRWLPSIGACGLDVVRAGGAGEAFPGWRGDFVAGGLSGENVDRVRVRDGKFVEREELVHGMGRVRDAVCGPDGSIYVVLNGPDKVIRLTPADAQ